MMRIVSFLPFSCVRKMDKVSGWNSKNAKTRETLSMLPACSVGSRRKAGLVGMALLSDRLSGQLEVLMITTSSVQNRILFRITGRFRSGNGYSGFVNLACVRCHILHTGGQVVGEGCGGTKTTFVLCVLLCFALSLPFSHTRTHIVIAFS